MYAVVSIVGVQDDGLLAKLAEGLLEVVIANNRYLFRENPGRFPPLYQSGIRFRAEPWAMPTSVLPQFEQFCPAPELLRRGWGDCAQLCCYRVAELREGGDEKAKLRFYCRTQGDPRDPKRRRWYHVQVRRGDGEIEDPSRLLEF